MLNLNPPAFLLYVIHKQAPSQFPCLYVTYSSTAFPCHFMHKVYSLFFLGQQKNTGVNVVVGKNLKSFKGLRKGFGMRWKLEEEVALFSMGCWFTIGDKKDLSAIPFVRGEYFLGYIKSLFHVAFFIIQYSNCVCWQSNSFQSLL